ncbi:MAG: cyclic nucleotide-binding domain-containing protein [Deltaproteobacteria bacterium]|nr:cyclic nucleotide-binding domain-containing protein [Deltaproteobacteria bacterium]
MISTLEKIIFLKGVELFSQLSGEKLAQVSQIAKEVEFDRGKKIFSEGDAGNSLFLIVRGSVDVVKGDRRLVTLGEKECFGEMAILDSEPRSATIVASADVVCLELSREDFYELMADEHEIPQGIIKVLVRRLRNVKT